MTKQGHQEMLQKLEDLKTSRPAAVKELARARELGDLSENGLYTAAKSRLISIDNQIFRIEMTLKLADVVQQHKIGVVQIGSRVTVSENDNEVVFEIVGDLEANPKERKVSPSSPIGRALIGKEVNQTATLHTPAGEKTLIIISIA